MPLESAGPRGARLQIRVAEQAGEVRQHPLGLAAHLGPHEANGGAPIKLGGLVLDRDPAQLGAAGSPGQRRHSSVRGGPPHRGLQGQVHRQGDNRRLTRARSGARLQQAGIARELEAHLLQQGQIVARVAAADLEPPALNRDLATIGQLQAGGARELIQLAQVALRQAEADPGQGADQEAELVALGIGELGQLAEQLAEAQAFPLADRARGRERSQGGQLDPGRDRERHILAGLAAAGVGGK